MDLVVVVPSCAPAFASTSWLMTKLECSRARRLIASLLLVLSFSAGGQGALASGASIEHADAATRLFQETCMRSPFHGERISRWAAEKGLDQLELSSLSKWASKGITSAWRKSIATGELILLLGEKNRCSVATKVGSVQRARANFEAIMRERPPDAEVKPFPERTFGDGKVTYRLVAYVLERRDFNVGIYWTLTVSEDDGALWRIEFDQTPVKVRP